MKYDYLFQRLNLDHIFILGLSLHGIQLKNCQSTPSLIFNETVEPKTELSANSYQISRGSSKLHISFRMISCCRLNLKMSGFSQLNVEKEHSLN